MTFTRSFDPGDYPPRIMSFRPIIGTLAYLWDQDTDQVLLVRRNARVEDDHYGKVNGLGGKLEADESVVDGLRRELSEEAMVDLTDFQLRGTITWTNFGPKREEWLGFIFLVRGWTGSVPDHNDEGTLEWVPRPELLAACEEPGLTTKLELPMWAGDRYFVPLVFDSDARAFHGTMPYDGDVPKSWTFDRL